MGCEIVKVYKDHGISGARGRDALCRDATTRQFDLGMAWSVDRLGRSSRRFPGPDRADKCADSMKRAAQPARVLLFSAHSDVA